MHSSLPTLDCDNQGPTLAYYDNSAKVYAETTLRVDMTAVYDRFLKYLEPKARILDAGSGSGRDTLAFIKRGYEVDAFDSSPALCEISTRLTGVKTRLMRFQEFDSPPRYDGIWACASLLHVPERELHDAFERLIHALKGGGVLYASFKKGSGERVSEDGRFYLDLDETMLRRILADLPGIQLAELWTSFGEGSHKGKDEWLNVILLKSSDRGANDL
jgi:SAM-dependent methyltransferase